MSRPVLYVLAGTNGAGKSSVGGRILELHGGTWYNPDSFARELVTHGWAQAEANSAAWREGVRRLDAAIAEQASFALETTLGGTALPARIARAAGTHEIFVWYCGLASVELHIQRVRARAAAGGHDIPEVKIRERFGKSIHNLIALLPKIDHLKVYDNSASVTQGTPVPDPILVAEWRAGDLEFPTRPGELAATPDWAKPIVEAALSIGRPRE